MGASSNIAFDAEFLEQYEILSELSSGGMGVVLRARQRSLDRPVALKFPLVTDAEALARFESEARMLANLHHPCIVGVFSWGSTSGRPYLVEELIEGFSLRELLARRRCLPQREALGIAHDIAGALAYVHAQGVVHRDLKPSNILIASEGAKLIDFGIARDTGRRGMTQAGVILGTPEYFAPEVLEGATPSAAGDVYALGTIFWEMLTGELPLPAKDISTMLRRRATEDAPLISGKIPTVTPVLDELIGRMLAREPADRPALAAGVLPVLETQLAEFGSMFVGTPEGPGGPAEKRTVGVSPPEPPPERREPPTSVSSIQSAAGLKSGRRESAAPGRAARPAARNERPEPSTSRTAAAALVIAALLGVGASLAMALRGRQPPAVPSRPAEPSTATAPLDAGLRRKFEALAVQALAPGTAPSRYVAYYQLLSAEEEAGPAGAGAVAPERQARIRGTLLPAGAGREIAAAAMVKLVETGGGALPRQGHRLAARDLAEIYAREAASALVERLAPMDFHAMGINLGVRFGKLGPKDVPGLKQAGQDFLGGAGRLLEAMEEQLPALVASQEVPLAKRQALATRLLDALGIELLFRRSGLPSPIEPDKALAGVVSRRTTRLPAHFSRESPTSAMAQLCGVRGRCLDVIVNERNNANYLHKDAQIWYIGALAEDQKLVRTKEAETISELQIPSCKEVVFIGWLHDLDPEDALALTLTPAGGESALTLLFTRPDCAGSPDSEMASQVRVSTELLPPGKYSAVLRARRLLTQRRFLASQNRMSAVLLRLSMVLPRGE
ncbi:MAG: serine/threonine protein kinase [Candidatus Wallbacteria bacterium]|nr:serine/threonine protein kinase [Candidatus Wallbacteria bacterium]